MPDRPDVSDLLAVRITDLVQQPVPTLETALAGAQTAPVVLVGTDGAPIAALVSPELLAAALAVLESRADATLAAEATVRMQAVQEGQSKVLDSQAFWDSLSE